MNTMNLENPGQVERHRFGHFDSIAVTLPEAEGRATDVMARYDIVSRVLRGEEVGEAALEKAYIAFIELYGILLP